MQGLASIGIGGSKDNEDGRVLSSWVLGMVAL